MSRTPFVEFCADVLRLGLTPAFRVLLRVAIDGVQPRDLAGDDRELARRLFGDVEDVDPRVRRVLVWRLGRGSGKTTLAAALAIYEAWTCDLARVGPGQTPTAFVIAPTVSLARIGFGIARELVRGSSLERYVVDRQDTSDGFLLRRPDGRVVAIRSVAASKGGANLRGVDVIVLVLDESEFFAGDDGNFAVTDRDQIGAVMPRLIGYAICVSTPWPTDNITAEYFDGNFGKPTTALAALGPSTIMRPSAQLADDIARERERDPENASREYDCEPGVRGGNRLFVEGLDDCIIRDRPLSITAPANAIIGCGGDLGLERDSSAIAIVARTEDLYELAEFDEVRPGKGQPLAPGYVVGERFAPVMRRHHATAIVMDAHYRQSAIEHLRAAGLTLEDAPGGQAGKYDSYMFTRGLIRSRKLRLPPAPRLLAQLRAITATPQPGGGTRITSPRRAGGGHGDVVSALVLAVWQAGGSATGRRFAGQGFLEWIQREVAQQYYVDPAVRAAVDASGGLPRGPSALRREPRPVVLRVPDAIPDDSTYQSRGGIAYQVIARHITVTDQDDLADLMTLNFKDRILKGSQ